MQTDKALVRRILRGDEPACREFFDAVYPALYRFALVRTGFDRDAAADVAQAAICKALAKLHTFRGEAALLTWLFTFCRRELYERGRRNARGSYVELLEEDPEVRSALESLRSSATEGVEAAVERTMIATLVQRVLDHLPVHYADALSWKYIDEVSVQEIGVRLGIGTKAAESLLTRARCAFRDEFLAMSATPGVDPGKGWGL